MKQKRRLACGRPQPRLSECRSRGILRFEPLEARTLLSGNGGLGLGIDPAPQSPLAIDDQYLFQLGESRPSWQQDIKLTAPGSPAVAWFGASVAVSGNWAVVGSNIHDHNGVHFTGAAYVLEEVDGVWRVSSKLVSNDIREGDQFGYSVAIDGDRMLIGARYADGPSAGNDNYPNYDSGAVYVFERTAGGWTQTAKLTPSFVIEYAWFGTSVALEGNRAVIGADNDQFSGGAAFVFELVDGVWRQQARLKGTGIREGDRFGHAVALDGDRLLVAAPQHQERGAVYAYERQASGWEQIDKLMSGSSERLPGFGWRIAMRGDRAVVGEPFADGSSFQLDEGAAHVYEFSGQHWDRVARLTVAGEPLGPDTFGESIVITDRQILIGAPGVYTIGGDRSMVRGAVHIFEGTGTQWNKIGEFAASDSQREARFANSLAADGDRLLVGAHWTDNKSGAVYAFSAASAPAATLVVSVLNGVLANDGDGATPLQAQLVAQPAHGSVSMIADGSFTYAPQAGFSGDDPFTYRVLAPGGAVEMATVTIRVTGANVAPVSTGESYSIDEDQLLSVSVAGGVLANDLDEAPGLLVARVIRHPLHGELVFHIDGSFSYQPDADYFGPDDFAYVASDGQLDSNPADVTIQVAFVLDAPTAWDDNFALQEDGVLDIAASQGVLSNDYPDPTLSADVLTAELVDGTTHGDLTLRANGSFEYVPESNYFGGDSFTYRAFDGVQHSRLAHVWIEVTPVDDDPPGAGGDAYVFPTLRQNWMLRAHLEPYEETDWRAIGDSVAIDGERAAVRGFYVGDDYTYDQVVFVLERIDGQWTPTAQLSDEDSYSQQFGQSLSVDGNRIAVGAPSASAYGYYGDPGAVYIYEKTGDEWIVSARLSSPIDGDEDEYDGFVASFGSAVDLEGDRVLVGDPSHGVAYVYERVGRQWRLTTTLSPDDSADSTRFGAAVALAGDRALVGAPGDDRLGEDSGAAYVFERSGGNWQPADVLTSGNPRPTAQFGAALDLDSVRIVIGGAATGAATVYEPGAAGWQTVAVLASAHPDQRTAFGSVVDLDGDRVLVADPGTALSGALSSGRGVVFQKLSDSWLPTAVLAVLTGNSSDRYGAHAALSGDSAIVAGPNGGFVDIYEHTGSRRGGSVVIDVGDGVLANDGDPDRQPITSALDAPPASGFVTLAEDGSFYYTPEPLFAGNDEFQYHAFDGSLSSPPATVAITLIETAPQPPAARAGGPYRAIVNRPLTLDGGGSNDAEDPQSLLTFEWDLAYDGATFDVDATGMRPVVTFDSTFAPRTIALRVTDDGEGLVSLSLTSLETVFPTDAVVVGRQVFYNNSLFDDSDPGSDFDDLAIALDKWALLPGQAASFANYTSYSLGLNGIMIDVQELPGRLEAGDFEFRVGNTASPATWVLAPPPATITHRSAAGIDLSDRLTIIWPDGAVRNTWLQVRIKAGSRTGLAADDVFYFGNAVGESGNSGTDAQVNAGDELRARANPRNLSNPVDVTFPYDYNRDMQVNAADQLIARGNRTNLATRLLLITPTAAAAPAAAGLAEAAVIYGGIDDAIDALARRGRRR